MRFIIARGRVFNVIGRFVWWILTKIAFIKYNTTSEGYLLLKMDVGQFSTLHRLHGTFMFFVLVWPLKPDMLQA